MSQVNRIVSGPPASICRAPASAARTIRLPPSCHARSTLRTTHGIQLKVAMWLGHINMFSDRPLNAKINPATAAARRLPVQRYAQEIHPQPGPKEMQQAKETQRPTQRQQQVNQRRRIKRHRIPLSEEGDAAIIVGIPQRQLPAPETFALIVRQRIGEKTEVAHDKGLQPQQHLRKSGENQETPAAARTGRR